jgi:DNA repair exonuclease SbcCD ATPase subunit
VSEASREMTLAEWVDRLPKPHLARRQLAELEAALAEKDAQLSKGSQAAAHWYSEMAESVKRAEKERDEAMAELVTTQEALTRAYQVCAHRLEERDEARAECDRFKHLVATYREHAESTAELRAERDRLKAERDFLRIGVRYAFHAVRASLSYKQEHNVARAEIALKLLLPDEAWRPVMGSFGFDLEQYVKDHLEQSVDKFIKEEDPVTIEEALLAAGYVKREFPEEGD